jgi:hypothetical protein
VESKGNLIHFSDHNSVASYKLRVRIVKIV